MIADDGSCIVAFNCGGALGAKALNDVGHRDSASAWAGIRIPVVFIMRRDAERLTKLMDTRTVTMEGLGMQTFTLTHEAL